MFRENVNRRNGDAFIQWLTNFLQYLLDFSYLCVMELYISLGVDDKFTKTKL